jgi:hypothetical protein
MKVTTVSASVRFSGSLGDSRFKTIELSAEATLDGKETWTEAQANLYQQLGCQLKALWTNGTGHKPQDAPESQGEAIIVAEPTQTPEHFCQEHQTPFKQYHRGDSVWWSHKKADGKWCREK